MVLPLSNAKITVEADGHRYQFDTHSAQIGSMDGGGTHFLTTGSLYNKTKSLINTKENPVTPEAPTAPESGLTDEQERGLKSVLASAKQIERTQFGSARAIERAVLDAEQVKATVQHDFNMAVLEALHAGLSTTAIEDHLNDAGFGQLEERVDSIHSLDIGLLYETEA